MLSWQPVRGSAQCTGGSVTGFRLHRCPFVASGDGRSATRFEITRKEEGLGQDPEAGDNPIPLANIRVDIVARSKAAMDNGALV